MFRERSFVPSLLLLWACGGGASDAPGASAVPAASTPSGSNPVTGSGDAKVNASAPEPTSSGASSASAESTSVSGLAPSEPAPAGSSPASSGAASSGAAAASSAPADPATVDTSLHTYAADDPNIGYSGRIDFTDPKTPTFSAPGVTVSVRFQGTGISALLGDEFRYGKERTFYDTLVDGQITGKISALPGMDKYLLASDLAPGEHTVALVKRTQASLGKAMFRGFEIAGVAEPAAAAPLLRIEFIGDSITAGEGIDAVNGSTECQEDASGQTGTGGWGQPFHNADRSYGVIAARALNADYHLTAVSGIGLVRDYSQMYDARTMADVYGLTFVEETASIPWDTKQFVPDVVVIALGTNDFSPGDAPRPVMDSETYASAYVNFVKALRGSYPDAQIFALTSQLLHDGSPAGTTSATDLKNALTSAVQQLNRAGDAKVHFFQTTSVQGLACAGHPNADQHAQLADELVTELRSVLGPSQ